MYAIRSYYGVELGLQGLELADEKLDGLHRLVVDGVRERIRNHKGRIRGKGADYLAYALLDSIVDSYYGILEKIGDRIEALEEEVIAAPSPASQKTIHHFKREMILLRKAVWPLREVIGGP